jgi:Rieske Fe-S protein
MLIVCKADLAREDFERLRDRLAALPCSLRWARRGERLIFLLDEIRGDVQVLAPALDDPAVEYVLKSPSEREIARLFARRELLDLAVGAMGLLAGAAVLGPVAVYLATPNSERSPRGPVVVGQADSIPENGAQIKVVDDEEFLIIRRSGNRFHALSAVCTHSRSCLVGWDAKRQQVICPCHHGVFDLHGNVVSGPPPQPLARREVVVRDGTLYLQRGPT